MKKHTQSNQSGAKWTRRQFVRNCLAVGGALTTAPMILPTGVLGAPGRPGANERIGIGGIGVGRRGGQVVGYLKFMPLARVVAVADVYLPHARKVAKPFNAAVYQDYRHLLDRKDVDAVIIATPEQWRGILCIHACQAGKDLYVEKPMSFTIREGRLIVQAVRKYGRVFQTGSQQRSMSANRRGCEFIRNGGLGKIHRIIAYNYPSPWICRLPEQPIPAEMDWDMWLGPAPVTPYNKDIQVPRGNPGWLSFRDFSGGEMTGWGSHGFDQVQWALGMDESGPIEVWTEGPPLKPPVYTRPESRDRGNKICSRPKVFFKYPGDIIMELGNGPMGGAIFIGERGKAIIDRGKFETDPPELAREGIKNPKIRLYRSDNHILNWLECIKTRKRPVADAEIGHRSATICHLGNIARLLGRRLRWDPIAEVFIGDPEANEYLDRPRRKPYELPEI